MTNEQNQRPVKASQEMVDIWVNNVFPDIAIQAAGTKLLGAALADEPLNLAETYKDMPGVSNDRWDPALVDVSKLEMRTSEFHVGLNVFTDDDAFALATTRLRNLVTYAVGETPGGVVRGTLRVNVTCYGAGLRIIVMWMSPKE